MVYLSPKWALVEFLRSRLTDPRSRAESTTTEEFDGGSTSFSLTAPSGSVSAITAVTVDGTTQAKHKDYYFDLQNQTVVFFSNTASGTDNVDITYKYGTSNWIYPDKAKENLSTTSFPRISVLALGGQGERLGRYDSDVEVSMQYQIDIWVKENYTPTISGYIYEGDKLAEYLGWQIIEAFRQYMDDIQPKLYNFRVLNTPRDLPFNQEYQSFHVSVDVEVKSINPSTTTL